LLPFKQLFVDSTSRESSQADTSRIVKLISGFGFSEFSRTTTITVLPCRVTVLDAGGRQAGDPTMTNTTSEARAYAICANWIMDTMTRISRSFAGGAHCNNFTETSHRTGV
jgi:hypothetical protein